MKKYALLVVVSIISLSAAWGPVMAQQVPDAASASSLNGHWKGPWGREGRPLSAGEMEMEIKLVEARVTGRVKATHANPIDCSSSWEDLAGVKQNDKVMAQYNLRGRCGKVDVVFWIDPADGALVGTYKSEYPSRGYFRLTRQ